MRFKKIRGHKAIWKDIEAWKQRYSRINSEYADREYVKIWVHPYSGISLLNSRIPEPRRETRSRMLGGLLDIYDSWKVELDKLGEPYYLKIWLFEPRFSLSQVVCAVGESSDFYQHTFYKPGTSRTLPFQNYGKHQERLKKLSWELALDENFIDNQTIGVPEDFISEAEFFANRRWVKRKLSGPHRKEMFEQEEIYYIEMGKVWIGGEK